ncbi:Acetyl esterase Axe7A precursor [Luteitalea pratensis]|uniref:Acetyl esterase Axe7A n=2 Tax=Luteitalea pratensis TaxID=1855912 RepID=A0A143PN53_LUTPR|nr:Acetyl esterase Axe7A precursor [Luteitalea pratensis]
MLAPTLLLPLAGGLLQPARAGAQDLWTGTPEVLVTPVSPTWTYRVGAPATFTVAVRRDGHPLSGVAVTVRCGPEMLPPTLMKEVTSGATPVVVEAGTMNSPGFLRCIGTAQHEGRSYRGLGTAGFDPLTIAPTVTDPADFDAFWSEGKAQLAKIPIEMTRELLPSYGGPGIIVSHVSFQTVGLDPNGTATSRIYGILCEPSAPGKYPALLSVPGAGVRPYRGLLAPCQHGLITLQIGIHGLPVTLDPLVYTSLGAGSLSRYFMTNLEDRDRFFYRRVYLSTVRSNDVLTSLPNYDGVNLGVIGGSQGGALAIVTAALDPRVKVLSSTYPALADLTGYLNNRAGGWPHFFHPTRPGPKPTPEALRTLPYYDVVKFARRVKAPGIYTWGYNDETVPPTSIFSAYNVITAPKVWMLAVTTGHNTTPEQATRTDAWMEEALKTGHMPSTIPVPPPPTP